MIIKNPYNFIAKHYRLINMFMLLPMVYLMLKFRDISGFFKDFVRDGYRTLETNFADTYVTTLTFVALAFMIVYNAFFYIVFVTKKKNGLFYAIGAIVYIVLLLLALLFHGTMMGITNLDATFANFVRDMGNLSVFPQYALIIVTVVKILGFNIKTLRFEKKAALEIDDDEEEIEIQIGADGTSAKRSAVHLIRELKYYILENKFVFSVIGVVIGFGALIGVFIHIKNNKAYTYNQEVSVDTFKIALKDSYITNIDYRGNVIAKDTYFLVVKLGLVNTNYDTVIDKSVFRIKVGDTTLFPTYDRSPRFVDIGKPYLGQVIKYQEEDDYIFVYELTPKQVKGTYKLTILNSLKEEDGKLKKNYKTINVKPKNITKEKDLGTVEIGKEIKLKDTTLGETTYTLKSFDIEEYYTYNEEVCDEYGCPAHKETIVPRPGTVLMVIEDEIKYDERSSYYKNTYKDFYGDFAKLVVTPQAIRGKERPDFASPMRDVTPKYLQGKVKIYEVSIDALNAKKIIMLLKIRNVTIKIHLAP